MPILALLAAAPVDCAGAVAQPELNACASQEYRRADQALNRQYAATVRAVGGEDGSADRLDRLRQAQRAWVTFRDAHCDSAFFSGVGASLDYTQGIWCRTELTEERTKQLAELGREQ
jgi:uncharacterized protein YecT (DUF1311 family)